ncbi:hypothetical protein [Frankia sp. AgKG'84/4]|uniref:hypothetical protein n=1 Tax=Frankia sp. AgKG'84/4 TaxID=573490 RepID=UPI00200F971A|nr:hypothetical protein [Frankia sp. AgKG'84/4]MCL9792755.1 hypothetical protein [Frankia sp. AgKG'84/4]
MTQTQDETFVITESGEAGRTRAADRAHRALAQLHDGIAPHEYVAALNVLRRMIANLGGDARTCPERESVSFLGSETSAPIKEPSAEHTRTPT